MRPRRLSLLWSSLSLPRRLSLSSLLWSSSASARYERLRIDKWIKDRLLNWPLSSCLHCRRPFVAGDAWMEVANSAEVQARARFHQQPCHAEWRTEREAAARLALGLEG